ncbi:MAG: hypothetical protein F4107_02650 [Gemmatimonadetes bacterium]|nr:hypothetical protein [Gemmatimonadota bacterium]MYD14496.1 hypothetical protein [Gemmatimonadota bacterium]MYI64824.1 hypothetical protein [Gemmatimonadota bacterium]
MNRSPALDRTGLLLLVGLCLWPGPADSQEVRRRWLAEPILNATLTDREGDLFGDPWRLIGDPGGGFLIAEAATIHAFRADGTKRWTAGRSGQGPGEFSVIEDVEVAPDGRVLALDREQPRVTVFDGATGELVATVLLRREVARARLLLPARDVLARIEVSLPGGEGTTWWTVSEQGRIVDERRGATSCAHNLTCTAKTTGDGRWGGVQAYRWSSQMVFHDADGSARVVEGVDSIPFPQVASYSLDPKAMGLEGIKSLRATRVDPKAPEVVRSVATDGDRAIVLMMTGGDEDRLRILDFYRVSDGTYLGSRRLPESVGAIALLSDGRLATLRTVLFPEVKIWELPQ